MVRCEDCGAVIGKYETAKDGSRVSKLDPSAKLCKRCKAELCADCYAKGEICLFCGVNKGSKQYGG